MRKCLNTALGQTSCPFYLHISPDSHYVIDDRISYTDACLSYVCLFQFTQTVDKFQQAVKELKEMLTPKSKGSAECINCVYSMARGSELPCRKCINKSQFRRKT